MFGDIMIIDIVDDILTPGDCGKYCIGNGMNIDENVIQIECCCDECNYLACCNTEKLNCKNCSESDCIKYQRN